MDEYLQRDQARTGREPAISQKVLKHPLFTIRPLWLVAGLGIDLPNGYNISSRRNRPMSIEDKTAEAEAELQRLDKVLEVAKRNGNQLFIDNIEREIAAVKRGDNSPLITDYLTDEERSGSRPGREA